MLKTKRPVCFGGDTGQGNTGGEPDFMIHKCLISGLKNQLKKRIAKYFRQTIGGFCQYHHITKPWINALHDRLLFIEEGGQ